MTTKITLAYSPDTDDAFMVHALRKGVVDPGEFEFSFVTGDIQSLNEQALKGTHDVTAISVAAYPALRDEYALMSVGASIGDDFGPAIVVPSGSDLDSVEALAGLRIAVPGRMTSAFFAACHVLPPFEAVPMGFLQVGDAVLAGEVDAGIIIHERGLDAESRGFRKLADLGRLWWSRSGLPLPLGANAIRRSLGRDRIEAVTALLRQSIEAGLAARESTLKAALEESGADVDLALGDRYISMYVNDRSLTLHDDVKAGIDRLFAAGAAAGLCAPLSVANCVV